MPVTRVRGSDGIVVEFPDGTDEQTITRTMAQRHAEFEARQRAGNQQMGSNAIVTPPPPPRQPQRGEQRDFITEVTQGLQAINRGIPFAQDVSAGVNGLAEALQGRDFSQGVQAGRDYNQSLHEDFDARRPYASRFLEGIGNALPLALSAGQSAVPQVAQSTLRGFPLFAQQSARAGATGAAVGSIYGGSTGDAGNSGDLNERLDRAQEGGGWGAALGAATPAVVNTARGVWQNAVRPAWDAAANTARRIPTPEPNSVGVMGRPMRPPPPNQTGPSDPVQPATRRRITTLADRARMTADDVEQYVGDARRNPQGQRMVDAFGDAGVRQLRPMAQAPGRTGQLAADAADQRFQAAPDMLVASLRRNLNVAETRSAAIRRLEREYQAASAENYNPLFERQLTAQQRGNIDSVLQRYRADPVLRDAMERAERIFTRDRAAGIVNGDIDANFARYAHYLKMGLDDAVTTGLRRADGSGAGATELRGIREMRRQIMRAIDDNIPGYQQARSRWASIAEAEEALDEGAQFLKQDAEEIVARMSEMTPFQREHARIGLAHEIQQRIGLAGNTEGRNNVANIQALRAPEMRNRLAAAFETPEQAADFLGTASTQNRLMRNAQGWNGGSTTQGNQAYEADSSVAAVADVVGNVATGRMGQAINSTARRVGNAVSGNAIEHSNNQFGSDLLRRIDSAESRAFTDEVIRILREREAGIYMANQASQNAAAGGAATTGRRE